VNREFRVALFAAWPAAGLWYFGTGLHPVAALAWLAPLPLLLAAPRLRWGWAAAATFAAYLAGALNERGYLAGDLGLPVPVLLGYYLALPLLVTLAVLLFRGLLRRGRFTAAAFAFPAAWAGAEFLVPLVAPVGGNWSLATTQADVLPVLQLASLTGIAGVSFVVTLVPAALAVVAAPRMTRTARLRTAVAGVLVIGAVLGYGFARLAAAPGPAVRVAVAAARAEPGNRPLGTPAGDELLAADEQWVRALPAGPRIVVFPEKDLVADQGSTLPRLVAGFRAAAAARRVDVVVGLVVRDRDRAYNTALGFPADGGAPVVYHKQYLVPGVEDWLTPGRTDAFLPDDPHAGLAVCADLGRPALGRAYARQGADLLLAPALDWTVDAWSQSRVQLLRGVENGYPVARAARDGYLLLADGHGRVLAQADADTGVPVAFATADLPRRTGTTPYTRWGDWFGYLCLAGTAAALLFGLRRRRRPGDPDLGG
jgi:apolipoprotein N-acyltransferase